jgi:biotin-dependent carboxylase-like uncharacterized protein
MVEVIEPGLLTTVQDLGRHGYQRFGVPVGGAMDAFALRAANGLVGNPWDAAGLEMTVLGPRLRLPHGCLVAVTGADLGLRIGGREAPLWTAIRARAGSTVEYAGLRSGCRAYLAVAGGIAVPPVMGSRATYLEAGLGGYQGRALRAGDVLPIGEWSLEAASWPGQRVPEGVIPCYAQSVTVRVVLGPQDDHFSRRGLETFLSSAYRVSSASNRTGYRLAGPAVEHRASADIVSDGIPLGSIQVPADGQPILMMADRPTTGGYAKIATVASADIPLLAQLLPGASQVCFEATTIEDAQSSYRGQIAALAQSLGCARLPA